MALVRAGSNACSIFVGNLPYDADEEELRELFSRVGTVMSVRLVCDRDTKQSKGYAFCDFSDSNAVQRAIEELHNVEYNGRRIRIDAAERGLHAPSRGGGPGGGDDGGPRPPPRRGAPPEPAPVAPPIPTMADRLAMLRDQEAAEKAKVAAAEAAERAEVGRLMETLTPQQVIHILAEVQRLAMRAPEVARALLMENQQLAMAVQHAQFLAGLTEEPPVPTEPEVTERARNVREKLWGTTAAPAPPHPTALGAPRPEQVLPPPGMPMHAGPVVALVPIGCTSPGMMSGFVQPPPPNTPPPANALAAMPTAVPPPAASPLPPGTSLPEVIGAASDEASRQGLMERLMRLSPAEIDQLPHDHKLQLLEFLRQAPQS